jgi:hypothetical protein
MFSDIDTAFIRTMTRLSLLNLINFYSSIHDKKKLPDDDVYISKYV